ncbi:DUF456 family protein [Halomicrococcus sp. SG-WS-1]|uniref:DUF456 family protein n=1 Tax=Halomicrococcus sp. SG-WS-1 TaxID=3439057 RepID=UPI003F78E46C
MDLYLVAVALLVVGVVGSVAPLVPGVPLSLSGVYLYWWSTDFGAPGLAFVATATVVGAAAFAADYFGGAAAARAGGASRLSAVVAAVVGVVALLLTGPVGMLVGVTGAVFAVEAVRTRNARQGLRSGVYAAVGMLASALVQFLVTAAVLVGFLAVTLL